MRDISNQEANSTKRKAGVEDQLPPVKNYYKKDAILRVTANRSASDAFATTQEDCIMTSHDQMVVAPPSLDDAPTEHLTDLAVMSEGKKHRKGARPSSWQRRKLYIDSEKEDRGVEINPRPSSSIPSTQPQSVEDLKSAPSCPRAYEIGGLPYGYTQWPRYMPKPSEMVIIRMPVFYCATFPRRPGLPAKREKTIKYSAAFLFRGFRVFIAFLAFKQTLCVCFPLL